MVILFEILFVQIKILRFKLSYSEMCALILFLSFAGDFFLNSYFLKTNTFSIDE